MAPKSILDEYVAFDVETSGLDSRTDRIVEVCAVHVKRGEAVATFNALVYYPADAPWTQSLENGHHSQESLQKGLPESVVARVLYNMCFGRLLIAHNAAFDLSFLRELWMRNVPRFEQIMVDVGNAFPYLKFIDTLTVVRDLEKGPHKLGSVCQRRGIPLPDAHLAMDDTLALVHLVMSLEGETDLQKYVNLAGYNRQYGWSQEYNWMMSCEVTQKPQGSVTIYHAADGSTTQHRPTGRPIQPQAVTPPAARPPVPPVPPIRPGAAPPPPGN